MSLTWVVKNTGVPNPAPILTGTKPRSVEYLREWTSFSIDVYFPLSSEELSDIHSAVTEIEKGKSHRFKNLKDALEWLHGD